MTTTEHDGRVDVDDVGTTDAPAGETPDSRALPGGTAPRRWRPDRALLTFCVLALAVGSAFAAITPSMWGADEVMHVSRVWAISQGFVTPHQVPDARGVNWGGDIPTSVYDLATWSARTIGDHPSTPFAQIADPAELAALDAAPLESPTRSAAFANTTIYAPVAYLPALAGMAIARAAELSVGSALLVMRLFGLVAYMALVGAGVAALRRHRARWLVFVAGLLPMSLFQASMVTTDNMVFGLCVLVGALVLKAVFLRDRLTRPEAVALYLAAALIPLCKSGYAIFLPLALLVPATTVPGRRLGKAAGAVVLAVGAAAFGWWTKVTAVTSSAMGFMRPPEQWGSIVPERQVAFVLENPLTFVRIAVNTLSSKGVMYFTQFFGDLGFTFVSIPALATVAMILAVVVSFGSSERLPTPLAPTMTVAAAVLLGVAMVFGAL